MGHCIYFPLKRLKSFWYFSFISDKDWNFSKNCWRNIDALVTLLQSSFSLLLNRSTVRRCHFFSRSFQTQQCNRLIYETLPRVHCSLYSEPREKLNEDKLHLRPHVGFRGWSRTARMKGQCMIPLTSSTSRDLPYAAIEKPNRVFSRHSRCLQKFRPRWKRFRHSIVHPVKFFLEYISYRFCSCIVLSIFLLLTFKFTLFLLKILNLSFVELYLEIFRKLHFTVSSCLY